MSDSTAAAILIGNELLTGKIADRNLLVLARTLRALGVTFVRASMIGDDLDVIAAEVRALASTYTWVFTSGGVGPTHDDVTIDAVARAFDQRVVEHPELAAMIRQVYGERLREGHLLMARIPERARLVRLPEVPWPATVCENVWLLPGVPEIFELKMKLLPALIQPSQPMTSISVSVDLDEGTLKPALDATVLAFPDVAIGSYPTFRDTVVRTKLTFDGPEPERCEEARESFVTRLGSAHVVSKDG